ncbi:MAG: hypothetical protein Q9215_002942 [Flavoplaca cf. flavocitrina]
MSEDDEHIAQLAPVEAIDAAGVIRCGGRYGSLQMESRARGSNDRLESNRMAEVKYFRSVKDPLKAPMPYGVFPAAAAALTRLNLPTS